MFSVSDSFEDDDGEFSLNKGTLPLLSGVEVCLFIRRIQRTIAGCRHKCGNSLSVKAALRASRADRSAAGAVIKSRLW